MERNAQAPGIALLCDAQGIITQVIRDDLGIADALSPGKLFALSVDRASLSKALSFAVNVREQGAVFGWELNVPVQQDITTLYFAGVVVEDRLLIMGAQSSDNVMRIYEDMMSINNEQMNALRMALKDRVERAEAKTQQDSHYYDELSRLNNELANLQRELAKKNAELERLNRLKDQFLGMAAHDLRTPLGIIMGYSDFVIDEAADLLDQEHIEFLDIIRSSSHFMLQLVNDLLDISTIESGQLDLQLQPTDLAALVADNVALNHVIAESKQIDLTFTLQDPLPPIAIDGPRINQVLNNLISNAIKYSFPETQVQVSVSQRDDHALIAVRDQGQGIPQDELDKLFQWFGKTRVKGTAGEKSTGLGLAISQRIVLAHGGKIWVESQVGQGSTFYVSLPLQPDGQQP